MIQNLHHPFNVEIYPLTREYWSDFERLFGLRGACGGCWCMWYRLKRSEYEKQKGEGNRTAMKRIVDSGEVPGLLAYLDGRPMAWCSVAPREKFPVLNRSRNLKPVDEKPVWSIVCLFIEKAFRRQGVSESLVRGAVEFAGQIGARIVEGYPIDTDRENYPPVFAHSGFVSTFNHLGFKECIRRSETRPIMRLHLVNP